MANPLSLYINNLKKPILIFFVFIIIHHFKTLPTKINIETKKNNPRYFKESLFNIPNTFSMPLPKSTNKNNKIPNKNDTIKMKLDMAEVVLLNEAVSTLSKYNKEIGLFKEDDINKMFIKIGNASAKLLIIDANANAKLCEKV